MAKRLKSRPNLRTTSGASMILVIMCMVAVIALIVGGFGYAMITGASREVRNAVDSAALNLSKRVVEIKVPCDPRYIDVSDSTNCVGMSNVNRVWGKAYLINANVQSMQQTGQSTGQASSNAELAYQIASDMNSKLFARVTSKENLDPYFNQFGALKPARLLGPDATISTEQGFSWATAMTDRGLESNVSVMRTTLPPGVTMDSIRVGKAEYVRGYTPIRANNRNFCFTTFRVGEMPHLISDYTFDKNRSDKAPIPSMNQVVPNAFKETGAVSYGKTSMSAAASAVANPQLRFELTIPYAYVAIVFTNRAKWYVEGKKINETKYGVRPEVQWGAQNIPLPPPPTGSGGFLNGYSSLGNEYKQGSVWDVLEAVQGDHVAALGPMLQRIQEICPRYTMPRLLALLRKTNFSAESGGKYYIFPVYRSVDRTDPDMQIQPANGNLPPWLLTATAPDGTENTIGTEAKQIDEPNTDWETIMGGKYSNGKHWTEESGTLGWAPGSGFGQCLGEFRVARVTECYFTGQP